MMPEWKRMGARWGTPSKLPDKSLAGIVARARLDGRCQAGIDIRVGDALPGTSLAVPSLPPLLHARKVAVTGRRSPSLACSEEPLTDVPQWRPHRSSSSLDSRLLFRGVDDRQARPSFRRRGFTGL